MSTHGAHGHGAGDASGAGAASSEGAASGTSPTSETAVTPEDTARLLGSRYLPTAEQAAVMAHPMEPQLVVAGAGSGKTETMSLRVVHLVHAGLVRPDQVLGLTFTRKAAGELDVRLRERLGTLRRALGQRRTEPRDDLEAERPEVSTYDSFAGAIYKDHALRLGLDPTARLITAAETYELAHRVVAGWTGPLVHGADAALSTLVKAVLSLDAEMTSLLASDLTPRLLREELEATASTLLEAPVSGRKKGPSKEVKDVATSHLARVELLEMVEALRAERRATGVATFADIADAARRIVTEIPEVRDELRARYRLVLLDEYQDTSVAQTDLLAAAFGGGWPVTAVGDPHQSIYGWRGASAAALDEFPERFGGAEPATVRSLAVSWRNDHAILDVANAVAAPLRSGAGRDLPTLGARPGAGVGTVLGAWFPTDVDEAEGLAHALRQRWYEPFLAAEAAEPGTGPTAAVLTRTNAQLALLEDALRLEGVPCRIVGVGGLVTRPEILDVRAALAVAVDPTRGDQLVRLVTGLGLGLADLRTLWAWAGHIARLGLRQGAEAGADGSGSDGAAAGAVPVDGPGGAAGVGPGSGADASDAGADRDESAIDPRQEQSLAEAIDHLPRDAFASAGHELTEAARGRLTELSRALARIRSAVRLPVHDAVGVAVEALGLDLEVVAASTEDPATARAGLDELVRIARTYAAGVDGASVAGFLGYLDRAEEQENGLGDAPDGTEAEDAQRGVVELLTMHRSKGLEWDVVAIPSLSLKSFPKVDGSTRDGPEAWVPTASAWLTDKGKLPASVRGDADRLPQLELTGAVDQHGMDDAIEEFKRAAGQHALTEERRLAYVAVTRARSELLLTWASFTKETTTERFRSPFLDEAVDTGAVVALEDHVLDRPEDAPTENAQIGRVRAGTWPLPPEQQGAAARRSRAAAHAVEAAAAGPTDLDDGADASRWDRAAALLLAERDELRARRGEVPLGEHLAATGLVSLASDPEWFARQILRPIPRAPRREADLGTRFHEWVEHRFESEVLTGLVPDLDDAERGALGLDPDVGDADSLLGGLAGSTGSADGARAGGGAGADGEDPVATSAAPDDERELRRLQEAFESSAWGSRRPTAVEEPVEVRVGPVVLRCRIDAVYANDDGTVEIVDWKTGRVPGVKDRAAKLLQLDVNRLAWSRAKNVPIEDVRAHLYYVLHAETIPARTDGEAEVEARIRSAIENGVRIGA
ncbi:UvrD-helicase domain-containing protein [Georgenia sp. Z1344]|uniref:UvrD-helicase domain-containing protein n=1 Tax=Georgenia sp. Z1344 TaxID=3416706 RepID=UPI003CE7627E